MNLQGIADDMKGKVSVVKIDTDKYPNIASRYGIKVRPITIFWYSSVALLYIMHLYVCGRY